MGQSRPLGQLWSYLENSNLGVFLQIFKSILSCKNCKLSRFWCMTSTVSNSLVNYCMGRFLQNGLKWCPKVSLEEKVLSYIPRNGWDERLPTDNVHQELAPAGDPPGGHRGLGRPGGLATQPCRLPSGTLPCSPPRYPEKYPNINSGYSDVTA